jgi:hypothetical protein
VKPSQLITEHFQYSKKKPISSLCAHPTSQPLATTNLFFVPIDLSTLDSLHERNHILYGLLHLHSFTSYNISKVSPNCSLYQCLFMAEIFFSCLLSTVCLSITSYFLSVSNAVMIFIYMFLCKACFQFCWICT